MYISWLLQNVLFLGGCWGRADKLRGVLLVRVILLVQKQCLLGQWCACTSLLELLHRLWLSLLHLRLLILLRGIILATYRRNDVCHCGHLHGLADQVIRVALVAGCLGEQAKWAWVALGDLLVSLGWHEAIGYQVVDLACWGLFSTTAITLVWLWVIDSCLFFLG